jgi:hypothetical protein
VFDLTQVVGLQRGAVDTRSQISVGPAEARRDFHRAGERDDLGADAVALQEVGQQRRIGGRDAQARDRGQILPRHALGNRQRQPAAAEVELAQHLEARRGAARGHFQAPLFEHVQTHQAQVADVFLHQVRDVVVAHEQHVERHVLAKAHELVLAARELQPAARQQVERMVGEAPGFLDGQLQAGFFVDAHRFSRRFTASAYPPAPAAT